MILIYHIYLKFENSKFNKKSQFLSNFILAIAIYCPVKVFDTQAVIKLDFSGVIDYARELYFTPNQEGLHKYSFTEISKAIKQQFEKYP